jgi:hypothetical protein
MRIHVHVGVHKTATTYIQHSLAANQSQLNALGIGFMPLTRFRKAFTDNLDELAKVSARIEYVVQYFFADVKPVSPVGLILSDENLVGDSLEIAIAGRPLISGRRRLGLLNEILAGHEVTMFMAIRNYADYIASSYAEALRALPEFVTFDAVKARLRADAFDWPRIIAAFCDSLRPAHVRLWRFEEAREDMDAIVRAIAFDFPGELNKAIGDQGRYSLSQTAVDELHELAARKGPAAATKRLDEIRSVFGDYANEPSFKPWSQAEHRQWSQKYDADCRRISDSLWLVKPQIAAGVS